MENRLHPHYVWSVTGEQYQEAFDDLQKQGMEKMIVDLMIIRVDFLILSVMSGKSFQEGLIVYTEDKGRKQKRKNVMAKRTPDSA